LKSVAAAAAKVGIVLVPPDPRQERENGRPSAAGVA
jgi:hypothetical protein